jgi:hypothetical protein
MIDTIICLTKLIVFKMIQPLQFFASKGYGIFPYIIIREISGMYCQIPIHFSLQELLEKEGVLVNRSEDEGDDSIEDNCVSTLKSIIKSEPVITIKRNSKENWIFSGNRKIEGCVVFSPKRAIYLDSEGNLKEESDSIPSGGCLITMCGETIISGGHHYNLNRI